MEVLGRLFGGTGIVKILRLFLFNPEESFESKDVVEKTRTDADVVRSELSMLAKIGFIKRRSFYREIEPREHRRRRTQAKTNTRPRRKRVSGWTLDPEFVYIEKLKGLLMSMAPQEARNITRRLRKTGNIKLIITAGIFVQNWDSRLDILIVGDKLKEQQLAHTIKDIESELGREIRYAVFSTQDFKYRLNMYDRLVRDVLDYPHQTIVDRIGVSSRVER